MPARATFGQRGVVPRPVPERPARVPLTDGPHNHSYDASDAAPRPRHDHDFVVPFATVGLIVLLGCIFVLEINRAFELGTFFSPSRQALIALGAINGHLVFDSAEMWRVFTAPMLHGGLFHLVSNCVVLALIGWCLEPVIGPSWFIAIFAVSALGGSAGSLAQNDPQVVSVGASGAISGLLTTALIASSRIDDAGLRRRMQMIAARILIPAILPAYFSASANDGHVDYGAHLGGAMAGAVVAVLLNITWNYRTRRPSLMPLAIAICCTFGIAVSAAFALTMYRAPAYAAEKPRFIPRSQFSGDGHEAMKKSSDWIARYPADPRGYYYKGLGFLDHGDAPSAAEELRHALSLYSADPGSFNPAFGHSVKMVLALAIKAEGDPASARAMARASCSAPDVPRPVLEIARKQDICP